MFEQIGESAYTTLGFFWKAGWTFVLGYFISSILQAFIPQGKLAHSIGKFNTKSISLASLFGAVSSSCSFAALAAGKTIFKKGAHFIATLAFLFASTNLVIELGIMIYIFLGWQYMLAEIIGGILLIIVVTIIARLTLPKKWIEEAREYVKGEETKDFDWKKKIKTKEGWYQVGHEFVMNWNMVWKEITIGFTVAGIISTYVPSEIWKGLFLVESSTSFWSLLENVLIAPFAAALTFIGSMGNIPIATILAASGVSFAGIMAFIYSDLIVPPIVMVNKKYYGWKIALYIAGVFYVSIVISSLLIQGIFYSLDVLPKANTEVMNENPFQMNYTFWLNIILFFVAAILLEMNRRFKKIKPHHHRMNMIGDSKFKTYVTYLCLAFLAFGLIVRIFL
ncbi:permease [Bacillaceae bacterium S4-13-58]